jgi:hypothetical protein
VVLVNEPTAHTEQADAFPSEYDPFGQLVHPVTPVPFKYLPGAQPVHADAPASEYVPAWQVWQSLMVVTPVAA